ncbi:hypothetical protein B5M42_005235 [Paenibacillus athensensis]|nr:SLC13 family permease [Paenibacillus athensensis]MCD1258243.1 hypothetical protein [Paenibacillus athensensis]
MTDVTRDPAMWQPICALLIFAAAYVLFVIEKWNRSLVALGGALLALALGLFPLKAGFASYFSGQLLLLLVSMYVISVCLHQTGLLAAAASAIVRKTRARPMAIALWLSLLAALGAALTDALVVIAALTPLSLETAKRLRLSPMPLLVGQIMSACIGGGATLLGSGHSRIIGAAASGSFLHYAAALAPLMALLLLIVLLAVRLLYGRKLLASEANKRELLALQPHDQLAERSVTLPSLLIGLLVLAALLLSGWLGWQAAYIAAAGAAALAAVQYREWLAPLRSRDYRTALRTVSDSGLIFYFGLLIMAGALGWTGVGRFLADRALELSQGSVPLLSLLTLWLSTLGGAVLEHVPLAAAAATVVQDMGRQLQQAGIGSADPLWWALSAGISLGGGATLLSSYAGMAAAGMASAQSAGFRHVDYVKAALPLSLLLLLVASLYFKLFLL